MFCHASRALSVFALFNIGRGKVYCALWRYSSGTSLGMRFQASDRLLYLALVPVNDTEIVLSCCVGLRVLVGRNSAQHVDSFIESTSL